MRRKREIWKSGPLHTNASARIHLMVRLQNNLVLITTFLDLDPRFLFDIGIRLPSRSSYVVSVLNLRIPLRFIVSKEHLVLTVISINRYCGQKKVLSLKILTASLGIKNTINFDLIQF